MLETEIKKLTTSIVELTAAMHTVRLPATQQESAKTSASAPSSTQAIVPSDSKKAPAAAASEAVKSEAAAAPVAAADPFAAAGNITAGSVAAVASAVAGALVADAAPAPTKKELVDKFILLAKEKDRTVAIALLAKFGIVKLPELKDKAQWPIFMAEIDVLLAT